MRRLVITALTSCLLVAASSTTNPATLFTVRLPLGDRSDLQLLAGLDFDILGVDLENAEFSVLTDSVGLEQIEDRGMKPRVSYARANYLDSRYKKPADIGAFLQKVEQDYPALATTTVIGKSTDGRDIWAIRLTDAFSIPTQGKAVILFDAMHHAREVMTPEIALDIVDYLTSRYASDPKVKKWMKLNEVWVVPMLNPDGNNQVWTSNNMWRKNTRGGYGVDNNRNYPFQWNSCNGSSGNRNADDYRGPSAGSEPETQALMDLARAIQPVFNISYHTASELVIFPMSCPGSKPPAAQRAILESTGRELAKKLVRDSGSGTYSPGYSYELLYAVDGGSNDWMYAELKALSYCIEANSTSQGFQPSYSTWRDKTLVKQRPGWQWVLDRATASSIRVRTTPGREVELSNSVGAAILSRRADDHGWAHFIVPPGDYRVKEIGARSSMQSVSVLGETVAVWLK